MAKRKSAAATGAMDRTHMIAEAAYYRAAERGFAPGHELADWLAAEADISSMLAPKPKTKSTRKRKEAAIGS